jgi:hypothetical protein
VPIPATIPRASYIAASGQTVFPYAWPILDASELRVYAGPTLLTLGTHYHVTGEGLPGGGTVVFTAAWAPAGTSVVIMGQVALDQQTDYTDHGPFPAQTHEAALDKLTRITQQLQEQIIRAAAFQPSSVAGHPILDDPVGGAFLQWAATGARLIAALHDPSGADLTRYQANLPGAVPRTLASKVGDFVSCLDFGFAPDQTAAGNSAAWATMMAAIPAGGTVWLPPGEYHHNGLDIADKATFAIQGLGIGVGATSAVRLICDDLTRNALVLQRCTRFTLAGFWSGHDDHSDPERYAIAIDSCSEGHLDYLSTFIFQPGAWGGLQFSALSGESYLIDVDRCTFSAHRGWGVRLAGTDSNHRIGDTRIRNTTIDANGTGPVTLDPSHQGGGILVENYVYGLYLGPWTSLGLRNWRGLDIQTTAPGSCMDFFIGPDVILDGAQWENIRAQHIGSVHIVGCWIGAAGAVTDPAPAVPPWGVDVLTADCYLWNIKHCFLQGNAGGGIRFAGGFSHIAGNMLSGNGQLTVSKQGIELTATTDDVSYGDNKFIGHLADINNLGAGANPNASGLNYRSGGGARPIADRGISFGDGNYFLAFFANNPAIVFDVNDFLAFDRSLNQLLLSLNGAALGLWDQDTSAGGTRFHLFDNSSGAMKRVRLHTVDLGGGVKKYLYLDL